MAEEVVLMKGNEAKPMQLSVAVRTVLRLSYYSPIGSVGNACRTETVGNNRHGSTPGGK